MAHRCLLDKQHGMKYFTFIFLLAAIFIGCADGNAQTENATETGISTPAEVEAERASAPAISDAKFVDRMTDKVFQNYLHLRTALVNSDAGEAATVAGNLAESFGPERAGLRALAEQLATTDDLAAQRQAFATLTTELEPLLTEGLDGGTIYKLHCPMAFDGQGADWFSEVAEIRNPFFGQEMLTCGNVSEEISK